MDASTIKCPLFSENPLFLGTFRERLEVGWSEQMLTILKKSLTPKAPKNVIFRGVTVGKCENLPCATFPWGNPVVPRLGWLLGIRIPYKAVRELHVGY